MKNKYRYSDEEVSNEMIFLKRFDISYTRFDSYKPYLKEMVREQVELSMKREDNFEIKRSNSNYLLDMIRDDINQKTNEIIEEL